MSLEFEVGSKNNHHYVAMPRNRKEKTFSSYSKCCLVAREALSAERHTNVVLCLRSDHCGGGSAIIGTDQFCRTKMELNRTLDKIKDFSLIISGMARFVLCNVIQIFLVCRKSR